MKRGISRGGPHPEPGVLPMKCLAEAALRQRRRTPISVVGWWSSCRLAVRKPGCKSDYFGATKGSGSRMRCPGNHAGGKRRHANCAGVNGTRASGQRAWTEWIAG